jgi:hypothetical protein
MNVENETRKHILLVGKYLQAFSIELIKRASLHDASKLEDPEKETFEKYTPLLSGVEYGSDEYKTFLKEMKPALDHHYAHNKHHPEYNDINGHSISTLNDPIRSMDLFDIVEMLCDWLAATERMKGGDIGKSIEINEKRFGINDQLSQLFRNTVSRLKEAL